MMTSTPTNTLSRLGRRLSGATAAIALCAVAVLGAAASPARAAEDAPALSVSFANSVDEVAPESTLDYVAVVENLGSTAVELRVLVTVPDLVEIVTATDAAVEGHTATWTLTVEPGTPASVTTSVHVGTIPAESLWLDASAQVMVGDSTNPVVASADIDPVAGTELARSDAQKVAEEALTKRLARDAAQASGAPAGWLIPVLIGGAVAAVALTVAALVLKSRGRRRAAKLEAARPRSPRRAANAADHTV
jgi:hypothetical protein